MHNTSQLYNRTFNVYSTLLLHKMWMWKTQDMNFSSLCAKRNPVKQKLTAKTAWGSCKNIKKRKEFLLHTTFLGSRKFRMVKWKQEIKKLGQNFHALRIFHSFDFFINVGWKKFQSIFKAPFTWSFRRTLLKSSQASK